MELRPYQTDCLNAVKDAVERGVRRGLCVLFTSAGKTVIFSNLASHLNITGRVLVLAHSEELVNQAAEKLAFWNPEHTVGIEMGDSHSSKEDKFVVASVQSLCQEKRLSTLDPSEFHLIVCDEAHHSVASQWKVVLNFFGALGDTRQDIIVVGVSATIKRTDGVALLSIYDEIFYKYDILEAMKAGWVVRVNAKRIMLTTTDISKVKKRAGDLATDQLAKAINTEAANRETVSAWIKDGENRQTVAFCVNVQHAKDLAEEFNKQGVASEALWGGDKERSDKLQRFDNGATKVITNVMILTEGWDQWKVQCILMCCPTESEIKFLQILGRLLRLPPGINNINEALAAGLDLPKKDGLFLDVAHNSGKHSLMSITSLFGLPPKLDLEKSDILEAIYEVMKLKEERPDVDLKDLESLHSLQSYVEAVDLLKVKHCPLAKEHSEFQWSPNSQGGYYLTLPKGEHVCIAKIAEDNYEVHGVIEKTEVHKDGLKSLGDAFYTADQFIRQFGRKLINMLRAEPKPQKAAKEPATEAQIRFLKGKLQRLGIEMTPNWEKMSKLEANRLYLRLAR